MHYHIDHRCNRAMGWHIVILARAAYWCTARRIHSHVAETRHGTAAAPKLANTQTGHGTIGDNMGHQCTVGQPLRLLRPGPRTEMPKCWSPSFQTIALVGVQPATGHTCPEKGLKLSTRCRNEVGRTSTWGCNGFLGMCGSDTAKVHQSGPSTSFHTRPINMTHTCSAGLDDTRCYTGIQNMPYLEGPKTGLA